MQKIFEKDFLQNDKKCRFWKKNCREYRNNSDHKLKTTEARRNYLMPKPNYHARKIFPKDLLAKRNGKRIYE